LPSIRIEFRHWGSPFESRAVRVGKLAKFAEEFPKSEGYGQLFVVRICQLNINAPACQPTRPLGIPIRFVLSSAAQVFANLMITTFMSAHLLEFVLVVTEGPAARGHPATPLIHCRCTDKYIDIPIYCSFVLCVYLNIYFSTCLPAHTRRKFKGRTHTISQAIAHTATPLSTHTPTHGHSPIETIET